MKASSKRREGSRRPLVAADSKEISATDEHGENTDLRKKGSRKNPVAKSCSDLCFIRVHLWPILPALVCGQVSDAYLD